MTRLRTVHRCSSCGSAQARWAGRCASCGDWLSLHEEPLSPPPGGVGGRHGLAVLSCPPGAGTARAEPRALAEVDLEGAPLLPTGIPELDRVLAGGLLPGSATLLGGEPGTGKSTLLLQVLASMAAAGRRCLLVAAEESASQIKRRAHRLEADLPQVFVAESTDLASIETAVLELAPQVIVVDSVQAVSDPSLGSPPGSLAQVSACAHALVTMAKSAEAALVLVGHVTKDGMLAGPRALEHLVDTVLSFEGDRYTSLRALRAVKHRFGPTGETGLFEMGEQGLVGVADPSSLFLGDRLAGSAGSAVAVPVEGYRAVLVEVQALVGRPSSVPRRYVTGLDPGRVGFLVAVLDKRAGVAVGDRDVYVSVAGGARAPEPATDLAVCLALASSLRDTPVPPGLVAVGEVGLGGEVRRVGAMVKRLTEAQRLGFSSALVPPHRGAMTRSGRPASSAVEVVAGTAGAFAQLPAPSLLAALAIAFGHRSVRGGANLKGGASVKGGASAAHTQPTEGR
ncbi:MAG TPA: DNA repair protein RadA [Acidimicrobiales bacterium]|nr:DNA repair protein RadA [Acidimicrobiales bacterium]